MAFYKRSREQASLTEGYCSLDIMAPTEVYWCAISHYARMPIIFARTAGIEIDEKVVDMVKGVY